MASDDFGGVLVEEQQPPSLEEISASPEMALTRKVIDAINTPLRIAQMNAMVPPEQEPLVPIQRNIPRSPQELEAQTIQERQEAGITEKVEPPTYALERLRDPTKPWISLPRISPSPQVGTGPLANLVNAAESVVPAVYNTLVGIPEAMTSSVGLLSLPALAGGGVPARLAMGGFAADIAKSVPEQARRLGELSVTGTPQEKLESALNLGLSGALASGLGAGALRGKPLTERITPDARSIEKAAEVHGDVRPLSREGVREMPIEESGARVQPQAKGGIPEKGPARDEVLLRQTPSERAMTPEKVEPSPDMAPEELAQHQEVAQRLIDRTRSDGINVAIEESTPPEYSSDVMWTSPDGVVHVNTPRLQQWIKEIGGKNLEEWMQSGLTHESIHSNSLKFLENPAEAMRDYYSNATKAEKLLAERAYYRKFGNKEIDPFQMGAEMFRRDMERLMELKPTEVIQSKGLEWVKQKFIDVLERGIQRTRQALGTKASKAQRSILDKYQQKIDSVRKAKGWEAPAELRMQPAKEEKKALEPNPPVGTTVKENLAQHRVEPPEQWREVLDKYGVSYGGKWEGMDLYNADLKDSGAGISWRGNTTPEQLAEKINAKRREFVEAEKKKASIEKPAETALRMEPKKSALEEEPSMGKVAASLNRYRMALKTVFKASPNRKIMDQRFDGADTAANNAGQQARNSIEIGSTPIEREATMAIIEANGDREKLAQFLSQSKKNPKAAAAVRYANANWDRLQPLAERTQKILDSQIKDENNNGISTEFREAYVPHIYDTDLLMGKGMPYVISGKGSGGSTGFKKGRTFDTVFDAIEAGYTPKSIDVGKLVEHRVKVGQRLINRKQWSEGLREIKDPTDNRPLVTDIETHQRPNGTAYQSAPMGYERREIIPGVPIAIHSGYSSLFDALTGTSRISGSAPGRAALATAGGIKHGLLLFDTFHASRIMQKQLFLTGKIGYGKGHSLLEYSDADLNRAVNANLVTPDVASWIKEHRSDANLLVKEGLNVGRIQEALYADMIKSLQEKAAKAAEKIGVPQSIANKLQFSKWVFEKVTRGAMMESALIELERISKAQPDIPRAEIARKVARDLNTYFGNLGRQGFFKSRTMQDLMNLSFLAPQWMESMARSEVKGALQMAKGVTIDPVLNRTILLGSLGKGMAGGLLAYLVGTQLLNMATRGHPTWDNPEEKHRLDAWIPDLEGGSKGFFMSPMSVPAELTHDMIRYYNSNPRFLSAVGRIMQNKISPLARASQILFIGKDWDKNMVTDDWDRVKRASIALTPTPLPLSPLVREQSPSGSLQRQLTASAGFKTEPAESGRRTLRPSRPPQKLKRLPSR